MSLFPLKPTHKPIKNYYAALALFHKLGHTTEGNTYSAFAFRENFESFAELCRQSINPDLTNEAIFKMLVQHLLTERIFRKVFNNQEFLSRNVIASEIEKVIRSITARHFSRDEFLKPLDRFYTAVPVQGPKSSCYI